MEDKNSIKHPIGLIPKYIYEEKVKYQRFYDVCSAISRYYNAGLKINSDWVDEYNELTEWIQNHETQHPRQQGSN